MAPPSFAAPRPAPPRPPAEPERPWWRTAGGWMHAAGWGVIVAACVLLAIGFVRSSASADRRAAEKVEVAREKEQLGNVNVWIQDTSANAAMPGSASRPLPTSIRARRMWVVNRMLVDRSVWERELMKRHGVRGYTPPEAWETARYQANARAHLEVATYLEGRAAAIAEIEKTSDAWMAERTAALARESGLPVEEIREMFPSDFARGTAEETRLAGAMLEVHRHLVRIDPRVRHAGGDQLLYERVDDMRRLEELVMDLNHAAALAKQAQERRRHRHNAALAHLFR